MLLQTPRLLVRPFISDDTADVSAYLNDPAVRAFTHLEAMDDDEVRAYLEHQANLDITTRGEWHAWAVEHRHVKAVIGDVGVFLPKDQPSEGDIGFQLNPRFHRQGLAAEAVRALCGHLFAQLDLVRLTAGCDTDNQASRRLLVGLGMTQVPSSIGGSVRFELVGPSGPGGRTTVPERQEDGGR